MNGAVLERNNAENVAFFTRRHAGRPFIMDTETGIRTLF